VGIWGFGHEVSIDAIITKQPGLLPLIKCRVELTAQLGICAAVAFYLFHFFFTAGYAVRASLL
jgi:hypothetical protein